MLCADISIVAYIDAYQNANIHVNVTWALLSLKISLTVSFPLY